MAKQQYTEQDLINGCRKGKRRFQELLYKHFYGFGMSICLRYASTRDDALEILNDGFMKVFDHIGDFDQDRPFKSWFRKILVNTALDHYRANRRHRIGISLDDLQSELDLYSDDAEMDHETELSVERILGLFNQMPEAFRHTFNLYEIEGYRHDEIAAMQDISPGTSRSNLSRAKKMLRILYARQMNKDQNEAV